MEQRGLSVAVVSPAKTEPIEMPSGLWARVGSRHHVLDRGPYPPWEGAILRERAAHCKVQGRYAVISAKTAGPIEMPFVVWTQMDQGTMNWIRT